MMKKSIYLLAMGLAFAGSDLKAQNALSAYSISQSDLKGTARFMGMAGAFGALGGDLSSLSQNPAGIGVYRSSDIGFTLDLDAQKSSSTDQGMKYDMNQTKFYLNNIGVVLTMRLPSKTCPNLNFGFTYNKGASFNRVYSGNINTLRNSMSNYIAGVANGLGISEDALSTANGNDPYNTYDYDQPPWLTVLGYDSYLINPYFSNNSSTPHWFGLWDNNDAYGNNTAGSGSFLMQESGSMNEFNIVFGGNINNVLYWGMNFDIVNLNYSLNTLWGENLTNAVVPDDNKVLHRGNANWNLNSLYTLSGTGFNYQLGFILKPVQQLRLGFAFHTPTWYSLNEEFSGLINYAVGSEGPATEITNDGIPGYTSYNFRTPWRIIASAAGVLGSNLIVSFDYEWANYGAMRFSERSYYNDFGYGDYPWDYPWDWYSSSKPVAASYYNPNDPYEYENGDISTYYKSTNTIRLGVEFKPISSLSIRAGYSYVSSPVSKATKNNEEIIYTGSLTPSYRLDNSTNYITCGLGYRYSHFYADLAYVYKRLNTTYHAFTPDISDNSLPSPQSNVALTNNQVVLSLGYRF